MRNAIIMVVVWGGAVVWGQEALSLEGAVGRALAGHPVLAEGRARVEAARGQRVQAGLTFNPKLILQSENTRFWGAAPFVYGRETDNFAYIQQTIESGGKRGKRVETAAEGLRAAELEMEVLKRQVARRVSVAYFAAAGAARMVELLEENRRTFRQVVEYHEARVKEGAMAESDLLRVKLEAERLGLAENDARLAAAKARIELYREMGETEFPGVRFAERLEVAEDRGVDGGAAEALGRRPEVALSEARARQARAGLVLAQANARPNWDALFGYKRSAGYNTLLGGVQVDLPLWNRNQGNVESAAAEVKAAEATSAAAAAIVRAEVEAARAEFEARRRQVREMMGQLREQAVEGSRIAQAAYRLGGADLLRLLDAERVRIEVELLNNRALMEYRQSRLELEFALGVRP